MVKNRLAAGAKLDQIIAADKTGNLTDIDTFHLRLSELLKDISEVSGAELMVMSLEALAPENVGVNNIAGHHGGAILPFYEFFTKSELYKGYVHTPNEQIAGFMANGLAIGTGHVGVAVATSGPGATNLVTPFYDSYMDSVPVVYITGNVSTKVANSMAFQEGPITKMVEPVAKATYYVETVEDLPRIIYEAFEVAASGRPGPVWIDVPKDIQINKVNPNDIGHASNMKQSPQESSIDSVIVSGLQTLAEKIKDAQRPVLYVGGGVKSAKAWEELREFAYKTGIPVTTTLKGKGTFPETDYLSLGMLGMHGTAYANIAVDEADLVVNIGARFDDRVTGDPMGFAKDAYIVHIDADPRGIGPNGARQPDLTIKSDVKAALQILNAIEIKKHELSGWYERIGDLKRKFPLDYDRVSQELKPQYVIEQIYQATKGQHAIVADVGQHQMWAAQYYLADNPLGFNTSGGSGTMGSSLAKAFGEYFARKQLGDETPISVIIGDESFMMNPQVLDTYKRWQPNIKVFIIDNKAPDGTPGGMVHQWYRRVHHNTQHPVREERNLAEIAAGFGVNAIDVTREEEVLPAIKKALGQKGPYVVNFRVDPLEDCLPMIPGGTSVSQMVTYQSPNR